MLKNLASVLSLVALGSLIFTPQVQAGRGNGTVFLVTKSPSGLKLRDKSCQETQILPFGTLLLSESANNEKITCNINGNNHNLVRVYTYGPNGGYIMENLTTSVNSGVWPFTNKVVNATAGLNLRDENCHRVGNLPDKTVVQIVDYSGNPIPTVCQVSSQASYNFPYTNSNYYLMAPIKHKGRTLYVANIFLQA